MVSLRQGAISSKLLNDLKTHASTLGTNAVNQLRHTYGLSPLPPVGPGIATNAAGLRRETLKVSQED